MNKKIKTVLICVFIILSVLTVDSNAMILKTKEEKKDTIFIQDGIKLIHKEPNFFKDVKKIQIKEDYNIYTDYPWGYKLKYPKDMDINLDCNGSFIRFFSDNLDVKISKEYSPYYDVDWYFHNYANKYILNETYREKNNIELIYNKSKKYGNYETRLVAFKRNTENTETFNEYLFAYIKVRGLVYYNMFFKTDNLKKNDKVINDMIKSFKSFCTVGRIKYNPISKKNKRNFNEETQALYDNLVNNKKLLWGLFTPDGHTKERKTVRAIEKKIDYQFPILLQYQYLNMPFPLESMEQAYKENRIMELTLQTTLSHNNGAYKYNEMFEIIDGKHDNLIREIAKDAKKFNHPFLFRLNNEMNSDWCDYSGLALLSDTDLYKKVWKKVYDIFEEENVDNAIWIFNPNDNNYPPANWNLHIAYFPGEEYVDMIGLTGYNTGDYYKNITGEKWRSFKEIYDNLAHKYRNVYSGFPWIITEFSSSSIGGDKEKWIKEMFNTIHLYPEIKIAIWWNYADFDYSNNGIPARKYWLDEKEEYLKAFKEGIIERSLFSDQ